MCVIRRCLLLLFTFTLIELHQCRRFGSSGRSHGITPSYRMTTPRSFGPTSPRRQTTSNRMTTPYNRGGSTSNRITTRRPASSTPNYGWNLPPRPGSPNGEANLRKVKIENNYHYNYPGYVGLPQPSGYQGYYQPSTNYHYTSSDTGSTALGFFLGFGLAKLTTPTFSHASFFDGYVPKYDHYTVHHYYHGNESVSRNQEIPSNAIVGCVGNTPSVCPGNTTSLCTSNGTLMCVVTVELTRPCTQNDKLNCISSAINCTNNEASECKDSSRNSTVITIPCVAEAKIYGHLDYVNDTIIAKDSNVTSNTTSNSNSTTSTESTTQNSVTVTPENSTKYPVTTTPASTAALNISTEDKKNVTQNFCVVVIAVPAKRERTKGETVLQDAMTIASEFIERAWGL